jgi:hypothetical protein
MEKMGWHLLRVQTRMRRSEKAKVLERHNWIFRGCEATGLPSTPLHTNTHTSCTTLCSFGWRIHCGVEVTESSINKQHFLSLFGFANHKAPFLKRHQAPELGLQLSSVRGLHLDLHVLHLNVHHRSGVRRARRCVARRKPVCMIRVHCRWGEASSMPVRRMLLTKYTFAAMNVL